MVKNRAVAPRIGKFIIFSLILIVFLAIIIYGIYLYSYIESSRINDLEATKKAMIQTGQINEVTEMYHFQDEKAYHILIGQDKDNKEITLFVPAGEHSDITIIDKEKTLSEDEMKKIILQECQDCNIINTTPAMVDNKPLWEITYFDKKNRYVIDYLSMYD